MMTIIYALQTHELYKKREQSHVLGFGQLTNESPDCCLLSGGKPGALHEVRLSNRSKLEAS